MLKDEEGKHSLHQIIVAAEEKVQQADERFIEAHGGEGCKLCTSGPHFPFSMAFQPIVNVERGAVLAYEALARGPKGEPAHTVLDQTLHNNRYATDQRCREKAIVISAALGILETQADLNINFYPNAVYEPKQCLVRTFNAAQSVNFPLDRVIFEVTEVEKVRSQEHLKNIMAEYKSHGLRVAIDDFGAGHSGLGLLSVFQPDIIKIDQALIHRIDERKASRTIVRSLVQVCGDLNISIIGEGVERAEEMHTLCDLGIYQMQGFFFGRPAFEALPGWPTD